MYVSLGFILFGHTWIAGLGLDGSLIIIHSFGNQSHDAIRDAHAWID